MAKAMHKGMHKTIAWIQNTCMILTKTLHKMDVTLSHYRIYSTLSTFKVYFQAFSTMDCGK